MAFAIVKSKTPTGIGQLFKDCEGQNACKMVQTFTDYGIPCKLSIKDNFGNPLYSWSLIWAKDIGRRQAKEVIRSILNHVELTSKFEMFVCSVTNEITEFGHQITKHTAFDLDDSYQLARICSTITTK